MVLPCLPAILLSVEARLFFLLEFGDFGDTAGLVLGMALKEALVGVFGSPGDNTDR